MRAATQNEWIFALENYKAQLDLQLRAIAPVNVRKILRLEKLLSNKGEQRNHNYQVISSVFSQNRRRELRIARVYDSENIEITSGDCENEQSVVSKYLSKYELSPIYAFQMNPIFFLSFLCTSDFFCLRHLP